MENSVIKILPLPKEPGEVEAPVNVYYPATTSKNLLDKNILATIQYRPESGADDYCDEQALEVNLPCLSSTPYQEIWYAPHSVSQGHRGNISYRHSQDVLFGAITLNESDFSSLEDCTFQCYREILNLIHELGYSSLLRLWNYFSDINSEAEEIERYKSFCVGRHKAFSIIPDFERYLTAASAIGAHSESTFLVYFIAAKNPGVQIENPRQISAFHYPDQYGPRSPSFTRAMLKNWRNVSQLFISGTASIVGHKTLHEGNVLQQLEETFKNLQSLIDHVREVHQLGIRKLDEISSLKVYVRHKQHYPLIEENMKQYINKDVPVLFLHGEICRDDLLVEIEGLANISR